MSAPSARPGRSVGPLAGALDPGFLDDLRAAWYLRSRDLLPASRTLFALLVAGYLGLLALLTLGASFINSNTEIPLDNVLVVTAPVWLLWSVIPFIGGGGGDIDARDRLAPHPVSPRTHLMMTWIGALLDLPYLIGVPVLLAVATATAGLMGTLAAIAFVLGAAAVGQLGAWLSGAMHRKSRGESLAPTAVLVACLGLLALTPLTLGSAFAYLPPRWFVNVLISDDLTTQLLWLAALLVPVVLVLVLTPPVVARALSVREAGAVTRLTSSGRAGRELRPVLALVQAMLRSSLRAISTRALLLSVLAIPFVAALALGGELVSYSSLAAFAALASAATISVNAWAFEGSGVQLLLSSPVSQRTLLVARVIASTLTLLVVVLAVLASSLLITRPSWGEVLASLGLAVLVSLLCAVTGTASSTKHPVGVDLDSLRARPTTFRAAVGFILHTLAVLVALSLVAYLTTTAVSLLLLLLYASLTVERAARRARDGSALVSALR